ncbi:hypothetical protein [Stigmatella erecta]|uniref:Uncharacterized protein n=1 Tax=Stigmatella erecta TaxID=83460 RepID=A0A1I0KYU3_9BACT|nr:hypothetical protein [Stigmatella erecta]SEU31813.1 hypothetical protein SAMN05443639_116104 [Stigmatella erecta]
MAINLRARQAVLHSVTNEQEASAAKGRAAPRSEMDWSEAEKRPEEEKQPLAFPRNLMQPPKSQVESYVEAIDDRIFQLDQKAAQLAVRFGLPSAPFSLLSDNEQALFEEAAQALKLNPESSLFAAFVQSSLVREYVALEKLQGNWRLVFHREPAVLGAGPSAQPAVVPLAEASLEVRRRFLHASEHFFRAYLGACRAHLQESRSAINAADATLAILEDVSFD